MHALRSTMLTTPPRQQVRARHFRRTFPARERNMITNNIIELSRKDSNELGSIEKPELVKAETPRKAPKSHGSHGRVGVVSAGCPPESAVENGA